MTPPRAVNAAAVNFANVTPDLDYRDVMAQGAAGDACRRQLGDAFERSTRGEWETLGIALGYRYEGSPIIATEGSAPPPDDPVRYVQSARPGHRAPHAWLSPGRSTLDLFGRGFVLLRLGPAAPDPSPLVDAAQACGMPLTVLGIEQPEIARLYGRSLVLVRPDGHSAWRADAAPADPRRLIDTVRGAA